MNSYFRIRLSHVPNHLEDIITTHCFTCGALGVSEALQYTQPDLTYEAEILRNDRHEMDVFFTAEPAGDFFDGLAEINKAVTWKIHEEAHKDWLEEWKKGFTSFKLVQDIWVVPSWLQPPTDAKRPLYIDPGMAFGTGTHATTQLAAHLVFKISQKKFAENPLSMMDVGTGTAILALLAEKLGFNPIMGVEIDPEARRVAKENVEKNKAQNILIVDEQIEDIHEQFDLVVANIIDGVLVQIKNFLLRSMKIDGHLIVTGILKERDNEFFEDFTRGTSLKVVRRVEKDEWIGYWFQLDSAQTSE